VTTSVRSSPAWAILRLKYASLEFGSVLTEPQSSVAAYTPVGITLIRRYENSGLIAVSITNEWRGLPPVAPNRIGTPESESLSIKSQNDLKRPEYAALNTGETEKNPTEWSTTPNICIKHSELIER